MFTHKRFRAPKSCESQVQRAHICAVVELALAAGAEALPGLAHGLDAVRAEGVPALDHPILLPAAVAHLRGAQRPVSPGGWKECTRIPNLSTLSAPWPLACLMVTVSGQS